MFGDFKYYFRNGLKTEDMVDDEVDCDKIIHFESRQTYRKLNSNDKLLSLKMKLCMMKIRLFASN